MVRRVEDAAAGHAVCRFDCAASCVMARRRHDTRRGARPRVRGQGKDEGDFRGSPPGPRLAEGYGRSAPPPCSLTSGRYRRIACQDMQLPLHRRCGGLDHADAGGLARSYGPIRYDSGGGKMA